MNCADDDLLKRLQLQQLGAPEIRNSFFYASLVPSSATGLDPGCHHPVFWSPCLCSVCEPYCLHGCLLLLAALPGVNSVVSVVSPHSSAALVLILLTPQRSLSTFCQCLVIISAQLSLSSLFCSLLKGERFHFPHSQ